MLLATLGVTFGWTGHAAGGALPAVAIPLQSLHILAALAWFGGLILLWPLSRAGAWKQTWFRYLIGRFSTLGLISMLLLGLSGIAITLSRLVIPQELVTTTYGQTLVVKLMWVAAVLLLAGMHRYVILPRSDRADLQAMRIIRFTLALESAVGLIVIWLAVVLATTPPPG